MLLVRRRSGKWVHCVHEKTGEVLSFQVHKIDEVGATFQVTIAIKDDEHNFRVLKPGDPMQAKLEKNLPPE
jgi:hypothetical protein